MDYIEQSATICCLFAALGGALEVAATAVTAVPSVRESEGIQMTPLMRWLAVLGNLTLAGIGSIFGHLIATWFGPVSLVIPYFFSSTLLCNMAIVSFLGEPFNKNMRVGTLVIVVAVILLPVVGPTTQEGQNFVHLMSHWYSQTWLLLLLCIAAISGIFLAFGISNYSTSNRMFILLLARASSICINVTVSRSFILGPDGIFLGLLIAVKLASGSLYSTAIVVQSTVVDQSLFLPLNATLIMLVNALTGIIIWEEWRCVQSWLGYTCVFVLLGLGCDLLLSVPLLNSENPYYGLNHRVSTIMPTRLSTWQHPKMSLYEEIPETCESAIHEREPSFSERMALQNTPNSKLGSRRISRIDAWREIMTPSINNRSPTDYDVEGPVIRKSLFHGLGEPELLQPSRIDSTISGLTFSTSQ